MCLENVFAGKAKQKRYTIDEERHILDFVRLKEKQFDAMAPEEKLNQADVTKQGFAALVADYLKEKRSPTAVGEPRSVESVRSKYFTTIPDKCFLHIFVFQTETNRSKEA